jgi:hypothetical protein
VADELLRSSLVELWSGLGGQADRLWLGGGYGLYLKQLHLAETGVRTLIPASLWPPPRATEDLDLLLSVELVGDRDGMQAVRDTLDQLGYEVIKGSEYLQFAREHPGGQVVKVDLLTAQRDVVGGLPSVEADDRRARPQGRPRPKLHAHPTDGGLALGQPPLKVLLSSPGAPRQPVEVRIPHPFAYLLMKLTAYRDRRDDPDADLGRHHALDVFRIVAMLAEAEEGRVRELAAEFRDDAQVVSCRALIESDFASPTAPGMLAMRQHMLWSNDQQMPVFVDWIGGVLQP